MNMKTKIVFFDIDETLLNCKSMFSFLEFFIQYKFPENSQSIYESYSRRIQEKVALGHPREDLNIFFYSLWKGFNLV